MGEEIMAIDLDILRQLIEPIPQAPANEVQRNLSRHFDKCGLFYRIFSRCKSAPSTIKKMKSKRYDETGKKMQDLIGVRIVLYFKDDIDVCIQIIQSNYSVLEIVRDKETSNTFSPMRLNLVCSLPENIIDQFSPEIWEFPIDRTFEIQIRTIFSEGWHEVEHDLRYKYKEDWENHIELSRNLNGVFATLETCDWAILNILDRLAHQKYKAGEWEAMLRNHLRIRMDDSPLASSINEFFDQNHAVAKEFFRADRSTLLLCLSHEKMIILPKKIDNIVFFMNELQIRNPQLSKLAPERLKKSIAPILSDEVCETC